MSRIASYITLPPHPYVSFTDKKGFANRPEKRVAEHQPLSYDQRLNAIFEEVVQLPADERPLFLEKNCSDSPKLRSTLEHLLKGADKTPPDHFLDPSSLMHLVKKLSGFR